MGHGPVVERVTSDVRLDRLPALTCWPEDGGPFITLPLVYTTHPDRRGAQPRHVSHAGARSRTTGMHWQIGKGGGFHYAVAEARGQALPATVFLGGPPALILSAIAPLARERARADAGVAHRGRAAAAGARPRPASADRRRRVRADRRRAAAVRKPEGPFGDHYGYYSLQHDYPVFEVQRIAHRADAIFPATVVGKPRQEDFFIGDLLQELLSPLFPLVMPAVERLWSYGETGYHSLAAAVVKQRYKREAMASAFRILGEGQLSLTKFLLVTDRARGRAGLPRDARAHPRADEHRDRPLRVLEPVDGHARLHRARRQRRVEGRVARPRRSGARAAARVHARARRRRRTSPTSASSAAAASSCGAPLCEPSRTRRAYRREPAFAGWPLVVLTDDAARDAQRDELPVDHVHAIRAGRRHPRRRTPRIVRNHIAYEPPFVIDARMKPWYPKELTCRDDIAALVTAAGRSISRARLSRWAIPSAASGPDCPTIQVPTARIPTPNAQFAQTSQKQTRSNLRCK